MLNHAETASTSIPSPSVRGAYVSPRIEQCGTITDFAGVCAAHRGSPEPTTTIIISDIGTINAQAWDRNSPEPTTTGINQETGTINAQAWDRNSPEPTTTIIVPQTGTINAQAWDRGSPEPTTSGS